MLSDALHLTLRGLDYIRVKPTLTLYRGDTRKEGGKKKMQSAGNYKLMRINKQARVLLFLDIQKIKLSCNENKGLIKNFPHPNQSIDRPS